MARVLADTPGVGKDQTNQQQHYKFRGVDDVVAALRPHMAKHGVFVVPTVLSRSVEEVRSSSGTRGRAVDLEVRWTFYGPAGDSVEAVTWGEGLDYGDKATNKAATGAFKYALLQTFAIADGSDDADRETPAETIERKPKAPRATPKAQAPEPAEETSTDHNVRLNEMLRALPETAKHEARDTWKAAGLPPITQPLTEAQARKGEAVLRAYLAPQVDEETGEIEAAPRPQAASGDRLATPKQAGFINGLGKQMGFSKEETLDYVKLFFEMTSRPALDSLTAAQASQVIENLKAQVDALKEGEEAF